MSPRRTSCLNPIQSTDDLKDFLAKAEGSALKAWLRYFDDNNDQRVTQHEFNRGMKAVGYTGDCRKLFGILDNDNSGELSLDEINKSDAQIWQTFRLFCADMFDSSQDMRNTLRKISSCKGPHLTKPDFRNGIQQIGWDMGMEDLLFDALDAEDGKRDGQIDLSWLDTEKVRQARKEDARNKASNEFNASKHKRRENPQQAVNDFKQFLKQRYGGYVRAWRVGLSPEGMSVLQKRHFLKALANIGWHKDVRLLWKAFDKDDSGCISIDELDLQSASILAKFHAWVFEVAGGVSQAFQILDVTKSRRVAQADFAAVLKEHKVQVPAKLLFHGLDKCGTRWLVEDDLYFMERWKPFPFLLAKPNPQAREDFKHLILKHYRSYLKAWRRVMDQDCSNRCNWDEFQNACKKIGFNSDVAGAWRDFDDDLSGFITLNELDPSSSDTLRKFKMWADEQFGSVRHAFGVFDDDGSGQVTGQEFRCACRIYGYDGCASSLFRALETDGGGTLSLDEVAFLDNWHFGGEDDTEGDDDERSKSKLSKNGSQESVRKMPVTKPVTPMVLRRSTAKRVRSLSLADDEGKNEQERVQPSLDLAEDVYSRIPASTQSSRHRDVYGKADDGSPLAASSSSPRSNPHTASRYDMTAGAGSQTGWRVVWGGSSTGGSAPLSRDSSRTALPLSRDSSSNSLSRGATYSGWRPDNSPVPEVRMSDSSPGAMRSARRDKCAVQRQLSARKHRQGRGMRVPPLQIPARDAGGGGLGTSLDDFCTFAPEPEEIGLGGISASGMGSMMPTLDDILGSARVGPLAMLTSRSRYSGMKTWMKLPEMSRPAPLSAR